MGFYADLHVHSKYSRATSRDLDLEHMALWARRKGVSVLGTGDFTHPAWRAEIETKLVPAEPGLFRLRPEFERQVDEWLGGPGGEPTRFLLEVEISTIYKKDDRTRKVHHLIYAPDVEKARRIVESLERIGNLASDGRPILGLDSRHLLEITLEGGEGCYLIPAHIWTPWFAVLGSKSGFDTIEHCYGDLAGEIFAVETGLSSDPEMNRRLSQLDRYTLVSNSDAHSPPKIGREACVFETDMDYFAMLRALRTGEGYGGTVEFFAEEGKYHLDGHRRCGVCLTPEETRRYDGACPSCGKPLTLGVMHRVCELADRGEAPAGDSTPDGDADGRPSDTYRSFVPLDEVLAEIERVGPKSKRVQAVYDGVVSRLGSELFVLEDAPLDEIRRDGSELLAEAIGRMREGRVIRHPGYDGEYGTIRLFSDDELERRGGGTLFDFFEGPAPERRKAPRKKPSRRAGSSGPAREVDAETPLADAAGNAPAALPAPAAAVAACALLDGLDPDQRAAAAHAGGPLVIVAGPGTGKTRTLTHRIAHLVAERGLAPESCLALTFTRRAAAEMAERLEALLGERGRRVPVMTFHALGLAMLREHGTRLGLAPEFRVASRRECVEIASEACGVSLAKSAHLLASISEARCREAPIDELSPELAAALATYREALAARDLVDFDDLVLRPLELLRGSSELVAEYRARFPSVLVDEYQDVDDRQDALLRLLAPPDGDLCVIGDPDQSIYGFRGADASRFDAFTRDFPGARVVHLTRSYRSRGAIVGASMQMVRPSSRVPDRVLEAQREGLERIEIHELASDRAEAEFVVHAIERLIGGSTFYSLDTGRVESHEDGRGLAFGDFAVLCRTDALAEPLVEALDRSGIPFQKRSHAPLGEIDSVRAVVAALEASAAAGGRPLDELLDDAVRAARTEHENIDRHAPSLRALASRSEGDVARFLSDLALGVDVDLWDERAEAVSVLTLHASKGIEFPVVFIIGCEDGVVPLRWGSGGGSDREDVDEERRLLFVGMTRARERLFLSHARKRVWRGAVKEQARSPFVDAIEARLLELCEHRARARPKDEFRQLTLFEEG